MSKTVEVIDECLSILNKPKDEVCILIKELIKRKNKVKTLKTLRLEELKEEVKVLNDELFILKEKRDKIIENVNIRELLHIFE